MARSRTSSGYFLGAAMTSILRGLEASINPGAVQSATMNLFAVVHARHTGATVVAGPADAKTRSTRSATCSPPAPGYHQRASLEPNSDQKQPSPSPTNVSRRLFHRCLHTGNPTEYQR